MNILMHQDISLVAGMNFNHVYNKVSKDTLFILVFATAMCRICGEPNLRRCVFLSADKYSQIHVLVIALRGVLLACSCLAVSIEWPFCCSS